MQRFVNDADYIVDDMLQGLVKANPEVKFCDRNDHVISRVHMTENKVGLVTGGGSGHEPAFVGYIGEGMMDSVAVGEVFASPPAQAFFDAIMDADQGRGVAGLFGNYAGDNMNVKMAVQMAEDEDVEVKYLVANDDIASAPKTAKEKRHGIAGGFFMWKVGGAKAAQGASLDEVIKAAQNVVGRTRSICVGLAPCTIPAVGHPNFQIEDGTLEFGVGHHGEQGIRAESLKSSDEIASEMTEAILDDFEFADTRELAVMISGLGGTPLMELYVLYHQVEKVLSGKGHKIKKVYIGNFVTSLDMNGVSLSIVDLDQETEALLEEPAKPIGMKNYQ